MRAMIRTFTCVRDCGGSELPGERTCVGLVLYLNWLRAKAPIA